MGNYRKGRFQREAEYCIGVPLRSTADRQEIATNLNSDRKQITDQG
jgi:hypothetical protein